MMEDISKLLPPAYALKIHEITPADISFEPFRDIPVVEWCTDHCSFPGKSGHCPAPHNNFNRQAKAEIQSFAKGYLIIITVPSGELAGPDVLKRHKNARSQRLLDEILVKIQTQLKQEQPEINEFLALGAGPCLNAYCAKRPCDVIQGKTCRFPDLAHAAMEAYGINVFATCAAKGHTIHKIINTTMPEDVPYGSRVGVVLFR